MNSPVPGMLWDVSSPGFIKDLAVHHTEGCSGYSVVWLLAGYCPVRSSSVQVDSDILARSIGKRGSQECKDDIIRNIPSDPSNWISESRERLCCTGMRSWSFNNHLKSLAVTSPGS